jgi:hypothetical protein
MASATALNADSALHVPSDEMTQTQTLGRVPVVIVFSSEHVNMQSHTSSDGKGMKYMRDHFRRQITNFFAFQFEVSYAVWARADVNNGS